MDYPCTLSCHSSQGCWPLAVHARFQPSCLPSGPKAFDSRCAHLVSILLFSLCSQGFRLRMRMLGFSFIVLTLFPRLSTQDAHDWFQSRCSLFPRLLTQDVHAWFPFCCSHSVPKAFNSGCACLVSVLLSSVSKAVDSRCACLVSVLLFSLFPRLLT